jgi:glycosyltransferase involved in cell wall biosynthesis
MKNILVVTQWGYEEGLIQSYTLPYLKIIHKVNPSLEIYLITQEKSGLDENQVKLKKIKEELKQFNIHLLPEKYHRAGLGKYFFSAFNLSKHIWYVFSKGIQYIHTFCTPAGGYGYILSKLTGKKLIVDSYEPHAEYMLECGVWKKDQLAFRILNSLEKKQAERASHLIATTSTMVDHTKERFGIDIPKWDVKPACVDLEKFSFQKQESIEMRKQLGFENKIVCVYAGKFGDFYLKEEVFEFYQSAFDYWKERFHVLLLSDIASSELDQFCTDFNLPRNSFTLISAPHHMVPVYLSSADFGLSPYRPTPSKRFCTPIKNGEYWALGLPVVITRDISIDSDIIEQLDIGYVLKSLDRSEYNKAIEKMDEILQRDRDELRNKIRKVAVERRSYEIAENIYEKIYQ